MSLTSAAPLVQLETLRRIKSGLYRVAERFVNLEAIQSGALSSRLIEYPFVLSRLVTMPAGTALDVGCTDGGNVVAPTLAALGWQVHGVDIRPWHYKHRNFHFVRGDMSSVEELEENSFDAAYAISSIEHFGLSGRYGIRIDDADADMRAVATIQRVLKPGRPFLLTMPYGQSGIVGPAARVYDFGRLSRLLAGWEVRDEQYWYVDNTGVWREVSRETAGRTRTPGGSCVVLLQLANSKLSNDSLENDRSENTKEA